MLDRSIHHQLAISTLSKEVLLFATSSTSELQSIRPKSKQENLAVKIQIMSLTIWIFLFRPIFSTEHREKLIRKMTKEVEDKVEVVRVEGLLADYVIDHNIDF